MTGKERIMALQLYKKDKMKNPPATIHPKGKLMPIASINDAVEPAPVKNAEEKHKRSIDEVVEAIEGFPMDIQDKFINDYYLGVL